MCALRDELLAGAGEAEAAVRWLDDLSRGDGFDLPFGADDGLDDLRALHSRALGWTDPHQQDSNGTFGPTGRNGPSRPVEQEEEMVFSAYTGPPLPVDRDDSRDAPPGALRLRLPPLIPMGSSNINGGGASDSSIGDGSEGPAKAAWVTAASSLGHPSSAAPPRLPLPRRVTPAEQIIQELRDAIEARVEERKRAKK